MFAEKARGEVPMVMYEPHRQRHGQEPSAPHFCGQEGKWGLGNSSHRGPRAHRGLVSCTSLSTFGPSLART